jgi:uncharacterized protein YjbJ (UPF0337 family)
MQRATLRPRAAAAAAAAAALLALCALATQIACAAAAGAANESDSVTGRATQLRKMIPRFGPKKFEPTQAYAQGVAILGAIPLAFAALTLVSALLFGLCRCCSCMGVCHACVWRPREEGYPWKRRFVPFLLLLGFAGLAAGFASFGLSENERLSKTLAADSGSSFRTFIPKLFSRTAQQIGELRAPVLEMRAALRPTAGNASAVIDATLSTVELGTRGFVAKLYALGADMGNLSIASAAGGTFNCSYCVSVGERVTDIAEEVENRTGSTLRQFNETVQNTKGTLTDAVDDIDDKIGEVDEAVASALDKLGSANKTANKIVDALRDRDPQRRLGTTIFFAIPVGGLALVVLAALLRSPKLFKLNVWTGGFLLTFFVWLVLAVHLVLTVVIADACDYLTAQEATLPARPEAHFKVVHSCLRGSSVVEALNASSQLQFRELIRFPAPVNLSGLFEFGTLAQFQTEVDALTIATFGFNHTQHIAQPLAQLNALLGSNYVVDSPAPTDNVSLLDPNVYAEPTRSQAAALKQAIVFALTDRDTLNATLAQMRANVSAVVAARDALLVNVSAAQSNIGGLELLVQPFIDTAEALVSTASCGFLGELYYELKALTCTKIVDHFSVMSMALFVIGLAGTPIIILSQVSASRVPRPLRVKPEGAVDQDAEAVATIKGGVVADNKGVTPITSFVSRIPLEHAAGPGFHASPRGSPRGY